MIFTKDFTKQNRGKNEGNHLKIEKTERKWVFF